MFATFGNFAEVQDEQMARVKKNYVLPAIISAGSLGLQTELGLALCFDIQVQNGGLTIEAQAQIEKESKAGMPEAERRKVVANAVADCSAAAWRNDVRCRKLAIATGKGSVHGYSFVLENWGLGEFAAEGPA
jgi:hypothetical protein